jgi:hypothetical protein
MCECAHEDELDCDEAGCDCPCRTNASAECRCHPTTRWGMCSCEAFNQYPGAFDVNPLAFRIIPEEHGLPRIVCYERVLSGAKLRDYLDLWLLIDVSEDPGQVLELYLVDAMGRETPISTLAIYQAEVERSAARLRAKRGWQKEDEGPGGGA